MDEITRRNAMKLAATAGVVAAVGATATASAQEPKGIVADKVNEMPKAALDVARFAALSTTSQASVSWCRSFDPYVYLVVSDEVRGWCILNERGFAIAAAASASNRKVFVRYSGYSKAANGGAGGFQSADVALDNF